MQWPPLQDVHGDEPVRPYWYVAIQPVRAQQSGLGEVLYKKQWSSVATAWQMYCAAYDGGGNGLDGRR